MILKDVDKKIQAQLIISDFDALHEVLNIRIIVFVFYWSTLVYLLSPIWEECLFAIIDNKQLRQ